MDTQGVIYSAQSKLLVKDVKRHKFFRLFGAILVSFSITSLLYFYGPPLLLDLELVSGVGTKVKNVERVDKVERAGDLLHEARASNMVELNTLDISIPAIAASSNVILNVDPFNQDEYLNALKHGVAHARGTGLPGEGKRIYLFAHSTNSPLNFSEFNAVFYQLRYLKEGDEILVLFNGQEYKYQVYQKIIVDATNTSWLKNSSEGEELVLQTCDPPGTTLRRLLIIARPVV